jgi:hypothetical protein
MSDEAVNTLARASSPYLRSAMHQPIQWHEWGEGAFAAAQREDKPVLLDIGAVWCHWCHVMDRQSYENPEIAQFINQQFIAVKVDRDERPDVDSRYQAAVQALSGQGGWPLTAFLTPDGRPFYGGTYYPPDDQMGRPGFKRVLQAIAQAYREKRNDVLEQAGIVVNAISQAEIFAGQRGEVSPEIVDKIIASARTLFDPRNGGFGTAPKFPHPAAMDLIIDQYARTGDAGLREIIFTTLEKMALGGVYDQLGGGFHRYSVDERWVVPHFEKMSYDNSELLKNYVYAWQATGTGFFADVARDIIRWMDGWLTDHEHGGFYASQDADCSLDDDGDYFTWTPAEARAVLTADEYNVASLHYDISEIGAMHHNPEKNVLHVRAPIAEIAVRMSRTPEDIAALLDSAKKKMDAARRQRPTPRVDKTVYTGWNAMCISAHLEAARALRLEDARHFALRSLDRILSEGWDPERGLAHVIAYDGGAAPRSIAGMLDDYACTALACLDAYETTADISYFKFARQIAGMMIQRFYDPEAGGFFDAENGAVGVLSVRRKPFQDSPTPAGNSLAAIALMRLYAYTNESGYRERAARTLEVFAGLAERAGIYAGSYGIGALWFSQPHTQVVVIGEDRAADELYAAAIAPLQLNKAVIRLPANEAVPQNLPPAPAETVPNLPAVKSGDSVAVVCQDFACQPPISDPQELARALQAGARIRRAA